MRQITPRGPRRGITRYSVIGSVDRPHAITVAAWFAHQVEEVIAREEEDNLCAGGHLEDNNGRGK